jgi:hypothetical protein
LLITLQNQWNGYFCRSLKTRKRISVILLLVLCIQLLPLKQTIAWLLGNQVTEELVRTGGKSDTGDPDGSHPGNELGKHFLPAYSPTLAHGLLFSSSSRSLSGPAVELPRRHADDIPTPPPNC